MAPYLVACSMQYVSTVLTYPGSWKTCISCIPVFGVNFLFIFPIIYQIVHLHNCQPDLINSLIFADIYPGWDFQHACINSVDISQISSLFDQFALKFHWVKMCFGCIDCINIEITYKFILSWSDLIMPKPVYLLTVHEAHKEYNSQIDQIRAKYKLLDSGECGSAGTPAFDAECSELAHLMARMSKLCKHLNLPMPKELHSPHTSSIEVL